MINFHDFHRALASSGVDFITGVPDSLLNDFCLFVSANLPAGKHVIAANEGGAIALAAGHHLGTGGIPLVYMQNSGIGNAMNPLLSLTNRDVYCIPMVLLIGWRGDPSIKDWAQHKKQGELTPILMDDLDIPYRVVDSDGDAAISAAEWAVATARQLNSPVALLAKKGMFEKGKTPKDIPGPDALPLNRELAMLALIDALPEDTIYVATTGRAARELYAVRDVLGHDHANDFLNVGAMGHASQIAMGIALARNDRLVVCLDGDAAAIMHMGTFAIVGKAKPSNLIHVILNNGVHESVGGQPSAGYSIDFTRVANAAGYSTLASPVKSESELRDALSKRPQVGNPFFIDIHVRPGMRSDMPELKVEHAAVKKLLIDNIQRPAC